MAELEMETWEVQVKGGVRVWVYDERKKGYKLHRLHGTNGPKRLRISAEDRAYNQEQIIDENRRLDPFDNGVLVRVEGGKLVGDLTDEHLAEMLGLEDVEVFTEAIREIDSELTLRRLYELGERKGTVAQHEALRELIDERYRVGGTQKTVREMYESGEMSGTRLT